MVKVTLTNFVPNTVPADGWMVGYRKKGTLDPYVVIGPFTAIPIEFTTTDPGGTLYEGYVQSDCGALESTQTPWADVCNCPPTYQVRPGEIGCQQVQTIPADVTNSGYCLAPSTNGAYSNYGARAYTPGFSDATLALPPGSSGGFIYGNSNTVGQWANPTLSSTAGPMNRAGVWIDSDCNGSKDSLIVGAKTTIAFVYNNVGLARRVYVGCGADNNFDLIVNSVHVATTPTGGDLQFKIWHLIPVDLIVGANYFNIVATGDGSTDDSLAMVIYDNPPDQILGATSDAQLNVLFTTASLRGTSFDVATCPTGWSLDVSGGSGNYVCRKLNYVVCNPAS